MAFYSSLALFLSHAILNVHVPTLLAYLLFRVPSIFLISHTPAFFVHVRAPFPTVPSLRALYAFVPLFHAPFAHLFLFHV